MQNEKKSPFRIYEYFQRFFTDILGVFLISFSIIGLLGVFNLSQGRMLTSIVDLLATGFGWGTSIFLFFLLYVGVLILLRRVENFPQLNLSRLIYLELFFFSLLGFLTIFGGYSLERTSQGLDGGVVGWGIARIISALLPLPISSVILFLFAGIFFLWGTGLNVSISKAIQRNRSRTEAGAEPKAERQDVQQPSLDIEKEIIEEPKPYIPRQVNLPPFTVLMDSKQVSTDERYIKENADRIEQTFEEFGIPASVVGYRIGPTVIQYALEPGYVEKNANGGEENKRKVRVSQISSLRKDLALALSAERLRIEAPIPGYSYVGIEIPNRYSSKVSLKSILSSDDFQRINSTLRLALGLDVSGNAIAADLSKMPHLLIAGTTGSGKSVCISALIAGLVMCNSPDELQLAILDPKRVELTQFNGLPHLIGEVETDSNRMLAVLAWTVAEMEKRYQTLADLNARDINTYNQKASRRGLPTLPKIVVFIDELADLMMIAPEQTEGSLVRLAQMARATGIHLVLATQRPSTDIVTGLIKANFPARIAFMVASSVDSRVILDVNGAETLLGRGDMLFLDPENGAPKRVQGVMVEDVEIKNILEYWNTSLPPRTTEKEPAPWEKFVINRSEQADELVGKAIALLKKEGRASASLLQRRLHIGYPRAARLMDDLEEMGVVGPPEGGGKEREVLIQDDDADHYS